MVRQLIPRAVGPVVSNDSSYPFSTMRRAILPVDLNRYGYLEEEYFLGGKAQIYNLRVDEPIARNNSVDYETRVIVRRPVEEASRTTWLSILNASQGYDIEDDWRRAWDFIISRRDTYVAVTAKPINIDALKNFDPDRYSSLSWGAPTPGITAVPGWDPFQTVKGSYEGLAWEILAQAGVWVRSGRSIPAADRVFMMGQSQSGVYVNTYLTFFDKILRGPEGERIFDGYLPGVSGVLVRSLNESFALDASLSTQRVPIAQLKVPVISISSEGDTHLFEATGNGVDAFCDGDGGMRRHWHVAGAPHSDARSRVIPEDSEIIRARRLPRKKNSHWLASLCIFPLEPVITAAMSAIVDWVTIGTPAAPSLFFEVQDGRFVNDDNGNRRGGVRLGLLECPLANYKPASLEGGVSGTMDLYAADQVLDRYPSVEDYIAACDVVDDALQREGYLEAHGRRYLHTIETEIWNRAVNGIEALSVSPQRV